MSISVILADDHAMVRESLASYLAKTPDISVVACVASGGDAVEAAVAHRPEVVLMDIDMPGMIAFDAARQIGIRAPQTRVVMLSAFCHDRYIEQALEAGACGYVSKTEPLDQIINVIREVAGGSAYYSPEVRARIVIDGTGVNVVEPKSSRLAQLSERELETLRYVARGLSNKEIAVQMNLAVRTVDHHVANVMDALEIHERVNLARFAIREGLAKP